MDNDDEGLATALDLAMSQAKRVQRESRKVVQQLGHIRDQINAAPTAERHKEDNDNTSNTN